MIIFNPLEERSRKMDRRFKTGKIFQDFEVGAVTFLVQLFKNMIEISYGLMIVNAEKEFQSFHNIFR